MMRTMKATGIFLVVTLLIGCVAAQSFPEAEGNPIFSKDQFESGEFRLGPARPGSAGALQAWRYATKIDPLPENTELPRAILNALVARPDGDDASYYWLAWAAEQMGLYTAAYEYYRISKMFFDFNRIPGADESLLERASRDSDKIYYSPCGEKHRGASFARAAHIYCPDDMKSLLSAALLRMERQISLDL